jgi:hypothetical protein
MGRKKLDSYAKVVFPLTEEQAELLEPLYQIASEAAESGKPGIILAQCDSFRRLRVNFLTHEPAKKLILMLGNSEDERA